MSRILEICASQEEAIVSRVLLLVHQAIDEKFPNLQNSSRQFTKTVFSDDGESTAQHMLPAEALTEDRPNIPPPPGEGRGRRKALPVDSPEVKSERKSAESSAEYSGLSSSNLSNSTRLGTEIESLKPESPLSDWSTRITLALLIAGIILLVYAILA